MSSKRQSENTYKNVSYIVSMHMSLFPPVVGSTFAMSPSSAITDIDLHAQAGENGVKAAKQRKSRMKKLDKLGVMAAGEGRKFKASYDGQAEEIEAYEEEKKWF